MRRKSRLQRLAERHERRAVALRPSYVCVDDESEMPGRLAELARMGYTAVKCYMGISPDDWDTDGHAT